MAALEEMLPRHENRVEQKGIEMSERKKPAGRLYESYSLLLDALLVIMTREFLN